MNLMSRYALLISAVLIGIISSFAQTTTRDRLNPEYQKWIDEDVHWIMTNQERDSFLRLTSNADRDRFVDAFWEQRNPSPGNRPNSFKEEHYRRLAFANQHFAAGTPGWRTDRGHIYILYGPPDSMNVRTSTLTAPPEQIWTYRHMAGKAEETRVKFVDHCRCGDYRIETPLP